MHSQPNDLPGPIIHPAAWKGEELFNRKDWLVQLSSDEVEEIDSAVKSAMASNLPFEELQPELFPLPQFGPRLAQIQDDLENGCGACMIKGLDIGKYHEEEARRIFWGLATYLGTAVSQSAKGEKIFSVRDEGYKIGQSQARGPNTRKRLSFHTDRCDVIGFLCLRQAKSGGENQLVSSVTLYNEIRHRRPDLLKALMEPFYYQRHNVDTGNERPWCQQPIFSFFDGHFAASYLRVLIDRAHANPDLPNLTSAQLEAMDYLEEIANETNLHVTFRQEPGDLLLLNNWVTFHRRNEFEDEEDPKLRRHLLRIWLAVPNSRPLAPEFADNYGSTAAGAIRGGMRPKVPDTPS